MPAPSTISEFIALGRKAGLLEETAAAACVQKLTRGAGEGAPAVTPEQLAGSLIRDGLLTRFQAERLLSGRWRGFVLCGKYRLLDCIGAGGMGSVYLCEHLLLHRRVAVKTLPPGQAEDSAVLERFHREARAVAALAHPNIVRAHDIDHDKEGNVHFLVMEYVDGQSLQDLVKHQGRLDPVRAAHFIAQAAVGLQAAHEAGLVHRDIKPGNLLLERTGTVKILDMGLARFFHDTDDELTKKHDTDAVLGTADYLSPEQADNSHGVDIRGDIYSLGCTFYYLLAGHAPFHDKNIHQKLLAHQIKRPPALASLRDDVAPELLAVLDRMMAKPEERYQEPLEVALALQPWTQLPIAPPNEAELARGAGPSGNLRQQGSSQRPILSAAVARQQATRTARPQQPPAELVNVCDPDAVTAVRPPADSGSMHQTMRGIETESDLDLVPEVALVNIAKPLTGRRAWWQSRRLLFTAAALVLSAGCFAAWLLVGRDPDRPPAANSDADQLAAKPIQGGFNPNPAGLDPLRRVFEGHKCGPVTALALSADSQRLLTGEEGGALRLWDAGTGQPVRPLEGHQGRILAAAFSPDGSRALSGGADGTARLWDVQKGECVLLYQAHNKPVTGVAFTPDGRHALSAGHDKLIRLWDVKTGTTLAEFTGHSGPVTCLALAADGRHLASADDDGSVRLWELAGARELRRLTGFKGGVEALAFSPDGRTVAVGGKDPDIRLCEADTGKNVQQFRGHQGAVTGLSFSTDGRFLVSAGTDKSLRIWDVSAGRELRSFHGHEAPLTAVASAADGQHLVSASRDKTARLWCLPVHLEAPPVVRWNLSGDKGPVVAAALSPDGRWAVSGAPDELLALWDVATGRRVRDFEAAGHAVQCVAFSSDGFQVAAGLGPSIGLWETETGKLVRRLQGHKGVVHQVAFLDNNRKLVSASEDGTACLWSTDRAKPVRTFKGHGQPVRGVAASQDGRRLFTAGADQTLRSWDLNKGDEQQQWETGITDVTTLSCSRDGRVLVVGGDRTALFLVRIPPKGEAKTERLAAPVEEVVSLELSADGAYALLGDRGGQVLLYDLARRRAVLALPGHATATACVSWPFGSLSALSAGADPDVRVWNLPGYVAPPPTGEVPEWGVVHTQPVLTLDVAPDGQSVVAAGEEFDPKAKSFVLRQWSVRSGQELQRFVGHTGPVHVVRFFADGRWLLSAGQDRSVRIWDALVGKEVRRLEGHRDAVLAAAFSPEGNKVLSGSASGKALLWDATKGVSLRDFPNHPGPVEAVAFLPDGKYVLTASDKIIHLWDLEKADPIRTFTGHKGAIKAMALTPDGQTLLSAGADKSVRFWDVAGGKELAKLSGERFPVFQTMAVSPDGQRAICSGADGNLQPIDIPNRRWGTTLPSSQVEVTALAFTPDGQRVISGSRNRTLRLWGLPISYPARMNWGQKK